MDKIHKTGIGVNREPICQPELQGPNPRETTSIYASEVILTLASTFSTRTIFRLATQEKSRTKSSGPELAAVSLDM